MLEGRRVVLGVTGGIAAYKAAEVVSLLKKRGAEVRVVMTAHACEFIAPLTLETLSGNPVCLEMFAARSNIAHISLAKWAELFVVAPATASALGKFANGIADDLLSTAFMAMRCPILLAPAMNAAMWNCRANQRNVERLSRWGARFAGPARGHLACGRRGQWAAWWSRSRLSPRWKNCSCRRANLPAGACWSLPAPRAK